MKRFLFLLSILLFPILFYSCSPNILLSANFESDENNRQPTLGDISGEPNGDQISYFDRTDSVEEEEEFLVHANRTHGSWLDIYRGHRFSHRKDFHSPPLVFRAISVAFPATISYNWNLEIKNGGPTYADFSIDLTDGSGTTNVSMLIEGRSRMYPPPEQNFHNLYLEPTHEYLGRLPDSRHLEFVIDVDHTTNLFSFVVSETDTDEPLIRILSHPLSANSTAGMKNPTFEIYQRYYDAGEHNVVNIVSLDDIIIKKLR